LSAKANLEEEIKRLRSAIRVVRKICEVAQWWEEAGDFAADVLAVLDDLEEDDERS
jgi:delta 1-pyrroline-5-carboxylate dehydrogenase